MWESVWIIRRGGHRFPESERSGPEIEHFRRGISSSLEHTVK